MLFSSVSSSTVIENGVPTASFLLYLFPIEPDSSYDTLKSLHNLEYIKPGIYRKKGETSGFKH